MKTIRCNGLQFNIAEGAPFWSDMEQGRWEPETLALLDRINGPGKCFIDIGAWMGPTTLYAASRGSECWSFEPDPVAFRKLAANVAANDTLRERVHLFDHAVTTDGAPIHLFTRYSFGDSGSSMLSRVKDEGTSVEVRSTTFDRFIADQRIDRIDLIKMDIEGGEFFVVPTMRGALQRLKPVFCVALHFPYLAEYFEKKLWPNRLVRRLRRELVGRMGHDPLGTPRRMAHEQVARFTEALSGYPFIFTLGMERITREQLPGLIGEPIELVFSHRDLSQR